LRPRIFAVGLFVFPIHIASPVLFSFLSAMQPCTFVTVSLVLKMAADIRLTKKFWCIGEETESVLVHTKARFKKVRHHDRMDTVVIPQMCVPMLKKPIPNRLNPRSRLMRLVKATIKTLQTRHSSNNCNNVNPVNIVEIFMFLGTG
jgi:hypothetical protein